MQNLFQYSDNNKRYHTLSYHNRSRGVKRVKAVLNAGLTCPNRDGSRGKGGCLSPFGLQKRYGRRKVLPGMAGYWPGKSWFL